MPNTIDFYDPEVPEDLRDDIQTIKDIAATAPVVFLCPNCNINNPVTNDLCSQCGWDIS